MYRQDSFFTLSAGGQVGLAALSAVLALLTVYAAAFLFRKLQFDNGLIRLLSCLAGAFFLLWSFVWLSPQVYYFYYQMIFSGLPWQVVIKEPPGPGSIADLLLFRGDETLSDHSKGLFGWTLILYAIVKVARAHSMNRRSSNGL